jgi:hypothetical protein
MKKFTVKSVRGEFSIYELEVEMLPSIGEPGLKPGEWKARILKPDTFHMKHEKVVDGKKEVFYEPDVWCWHAFYETKEEACAAASKLIEHEFEFNLRKYGKTYTDEEVAAAFMAIRYVPLTS